MIQRRLWNWAFLLVAVGLACGSAMADEVTLATSTTLACFAASGSCTPTSSSAAYAPDPSHLFFTGSASNATTSGGLATLVLGTFTLNDHADFTPTGEFIGQVTFTLPEIIQGSDTSLFIASVSGTVVKNSDDTVVRIDFDNTPQTFVYSNSAASGQFDFAVGDVVLDITQNGNRTIQAAWNGYVSNAIETPLTQDSNGTDPADPATAVPEPASLLLLAGGLIFTLAGQRRRLATARVQERTD